jgi:hypothetical protein
MCRGLVRSVGEEVWNVGEHRFSRRGKIRLSSLPTIASLEAMVGAISLSITGGG